LFVVRNCGTLSARTSAAVAAFVLEYVDTGTAI